MTNAEWDALEQECWERGEWPLYADLETERLDRIRISAFAIATGRLVERAATDLDRAIASVERARKAAEASLRVFHRTADFAELASVFAARVQAGDVDEETRGAVATLLEEVIG